MLVNNPTGMNSFVTRVKVPRVTAPTPIQPVTPALCPCSVELGFPCRGWSSFRVRFEEQDRDFASGFGSVLREVRPS
jgi:hypothetical protein